MITSGLFLFILLAPRSPCDTCRRGAQFCGRLAPTHECHCRGPLPNRILARARSARRRLAHLMQQAAAPIDDSEAASEKRQHHGLVALDAHRGKARFDDTAMRNQIRHRNRVRSDVANLIDIPYRSGMLGLTTQTAGGCPLRKWGMALRSQNRSNDCQRDVPVQGLRRHIAHRTAEQSWCK